MSFHVVIRYRMSSTLCRQSSCMGIICVMAKRTKTVCVSRATKSSVLCRATWSCFRPLVLLCKADRVVNKCRDLDLVRPGVSRAALVDEVGRGWCLGERLKCKRDNEREVLPHFLDGTCLCSYKRSAVELLKSHNKDIGVDTPYHAAACDESMIDTGNGMESTHVVELDIVIQESSIMTQGRRILSCMILFVFETRTTFPCQLGLCLTVALRLPSMRAGGYASVVQQVVAAACSQRPSSVRLIKDPPSCRTAHTWGEILL